VGFFLILRGVTEMKGIGAEKCLIVARKGKE